MGCPNDILDLFNPATMISCSADSTAKYVANSAFEAIVGEFAKGASSVAYGLTTGWMDFPTPDLRGAANADGTTGTAGPVAFMQNSLSWVTAWVAILCLMIAAARMIWMRRGEPAKEAMMGLLTLILVSSGGVAFIQVAVRAGDEFSAWLIARSLGCNPGEGNGCSVAFGKRLLKLIAMDAQQHMLAVTFVLSILMIVSSWIQMGFLMARNAMLILCAGTLPLSAAASGTESGRSWFRKQAGWTVAFVLFKPVAAIIYAAAFAGIGKSAANDTWTQIYGVTLLLLAALTLPALMRFVTPLVAAAATGGVGAGAVVAGAGRAVATGAVAVKSLGTSTVAKTGASMAANGAVQAGGGGGRSAPPVPAQAAGAATGQGSGQSAGTSGAQNGAPPAGSSVGQGTGPSSATGGPATQTTSGARSGSATPAPTPGNPTTRSGGGPSGSNT